MKNIKVKDATLEKIFSIINERKKYVSRGENSTLFELAEIHELTMLQSILAKEFKYGD